MCKSMNPRRWLTFANRYVTRRLQHTWSTGTATRGKDKAMGKNKKRFISKGEASHFHVTGTEAAPIRAYGDSEDCSRCTYAWEKRTGLNQQTAAAPEGPLDECSASVCRDKSEKAIPSEREYPEVESPSIPAQDLESSEYVIVDASLIPPSESSQVNPLK